MHRDLWSTASIATAPAGRCCPRPHVHGAVDAHAHVHVPQLAATQVAVQLPAAALPPHPTATWMVGIHAVQHPVEVPSRGGRPPLVCRNSSGDRPRGTTGRPNHTRSKVKADQREATLLTDMTHPPQAMKHNALCLNPVITYKSIGRPLLTCIDT